ncbi:MAG: bifunctional phosphoribosylaminoimidazolecarboxamide formyltransferase/IMP cyclohydrolase [Oscillospiraceae bacterium]|jgi:phosphoribosylaminoimidazolecarboxamide formyltransferase/IMP cyclohydrolase|nr:bifunctional phosphoribosylaminoimidazolecarboxamide formyltransferase/IMP cyclohydrolase [Oscillospiraceae bacterium]
MKKRALFSVSDKTGVCGFARRAAALGYEIISTGGTQKTLEEAGVPVVNVSEVTGFPECLDGRLKTLHPAIHGGILAVRGSRDHMAQMELLNIELIDIVVINLYPFKQTILREGVRLDEAIENIDIGGPALIRSAAKNWPDVVVAVDPSDYEGILEQLENGGVPRERRFELARKVFEHTAHYDALIADYLRRQTGAGYPETLTVTYEKVQDLRYGENPHQTAAFYREVGSPQGSLVRAEHLHGKEMSFCNINDAAAAAALIKEFDCPCVVAVKHATPCGVGLGGTLTEAYRKAYDADPVSIYGGIVALNRVCEADTAEALSETPLDIILAPGYTDEALELLTCKKNTRILLLEGICEPVPEDALDFKKVSGGLLVQSADRAASGPAALKAVTKREPAPEELDALGLAWCVCKHVKSNAIVLARDGMTVGIGPGQTNRVTAAEIAIRYAGGRARGSVMASDAFFPFPDCVEAAGKAGITAIIQPGGSIRDQASVEAADRLGIAMVFTGERHFKH